MKKLIFIAAILYGSFVNAQPLIEQESLVKWLTFKEATELNKKQERPIMIDIYTDWCGWCKRMMATTFSDPNLSAYINNNFYPVRFNAETFDTHEWMGETYVNKGLGNRPTHELAIKLLTGKLSYPSIVFVANNYQFNMLAAGYMEARRFEPVLIYVRESVFLTSDLESFRTNFNRTYYEPDTLPPPVVNSYTIEEAVNNNEKRKRKTMVYINSDWCVSCKVMANSSLLDTAIVNRMNNKFWYVPFNAATKDTVHFAGSSFGLLPNGINGFAFAMTNNSLTLPTTVIFNEDMRIIGVIPRYLPAVFLKKILDYYTSNAYLTVKWDDYQKSTPN